jgi:hypothetical protein
LFWHADLPHGGGEIRKQNSTRRSLVLHYTAVDRTPHYFHYIDDERRQKLRVQGGFVSSSYYAPDRLARPT